MAGEKKRRQLGRGLSALLGEEGEDYGEPDRLRVSRMVPVEFLHPGPYQPRRRMDKEQISALARSIRDKGVLQPLLVRRHPEKADAFEIVAGERRWRAAQEAQLHDIPVVVKDFSDREVLEIALVENLQRQDLSPLEEAEGYRRLLKEFSHTQAKLARAVGKSRSHVANMIRLLALPDAVKALLDGGQLSAGHARALLNAEDPAALARQVVRRGLNVRQTEKLAQEKGVRARPRTAEKDADTLSLERDLTNLLGLKVEIRFRRGRGSLIVHYTSLDQLDDILQRLSHGAGAPRPGGGRAEEERAEPDPTEAFDAFALDVPGAGPPPAEAEPADVAEAAETAETGDEPPFGAASGAGESTESTEEAAEASETDSGDEPPSDGEPAEPIESTESTESTESRGAGEGVKGGEDSAEGETAGPAAERPEEREPPDTPE